jgi:P27 family predicted phage terminase small subunit
MGKRGPIPKSNKLRKLEGNPSKRPPQGQSPIPADLVDCPDWLSPEAKQEWARVAPELSRLGLLTKLDMAMLAGFCVSCSWWRRSQEVLITQGTIYVSVKGKLETRPEVMIAKIAGEQMNAFAAEFGLTPVSRARMKLSPGNEVIDPMEALLRGIDGGGKK